MKHLLTLLLLISTLWTQGQKITYYPKSATQTFGIATVVPDNYDPSKQYMTWIIGAGIGERGNGSTAALQNLVGWGGFGNLKTAANIYKFILVFVNTANNYEKGEFQYALKWAEDHLPVDENNINVLGHSLGSYGAGNYAFSDKEFCKKINIWFCSASGPYSNKSIYQNIVDNNIKVWGVTAANDKSSGTNPIYVTQLYDKIKAIKPDAEVIITEFPATTWPDARTAHNAVLSRLTGISWTGISLDMIRGRKLTTAPKMSIYQWALSNPKGSIYQSPDHAYTGPKWAAPIVTKPPVFEKPITTTRSIIGYNVIGENIKISVLMSDGKWQTIELAGDENREIWIPSKALDRPTVRFKKAGKKMQVVK